MKKMNWLQFNGMVLFANNEMVNNGKKVFLIEDEELVEGVIVDMMYFMNGRCETNRVCVTIQTCTNSIYRLYVSKLNPSGKIYFANSFRDVSLYASADDYFHGKSLFFDLKMGNVLHTQLPFIGISTDGMKLIGDAFYINERTIQIERMQSISVNSGYRISKRNNGVLIATFEDDYQRFYSNTDECAEILRENVPVKTFNSTTGTKIVITIDTETNTIDMVRK